MASHASADDSFVRVARWQHALSQVDPLGENHAFLDDGYVAGGSTITVALGNFPEQLLHYHRTGPSAITSPQIQRGCTAFVHIRISCVIGASGIHVASRASAGDPFVRAARWQVCLVAG